MKGSDLIKLIEKNGLEDFDINIIYNDKEDCEFAWPNIRKFIIEGIGDIGYSDKSAQLQISEER